MKKRTKKYNPYNSARRTSKAVLKNKGMLYVLGESPVPVNLKTNKQILFDEVLFNAFTKFQYHWSVFIAVFGKDVHGQEYIKSEVIQTKEPYYNDELVDVLNVHHERLFNEQNQKQIISLGWLAVPDNTDWNEKDLFKLFKDNRAFDYKRDEAGNFIQI
jgi:hypothetical protein